MEKNRNRIGYGKERQYGNRRNFGNRTRLPQSNFENSLVHKTKQMLCHTNKEDK